ncbi:MAG TPA: PQQ-dependent sugar dehydrogenase [Gemmatimonadales bacterium]|nr:PQQ-dependent sugar dehydrogenase [Gemmatimonadales bacterium]
MRVTRNPDQRPPTRRSHRVGLTLAAAALLSSCGPRPIDAQAQARRSPTPEATPGVVRVEIVASGLERPWGFEFLPDGRVLVTEQAGRLRIVASTGRLSEPIAGVPEVMETGQGGLLDVALDPGFAKNRVIYLSYSERGEGGAGTAVARARLGDGRLEDLRVIYRQQPKVDGPNHWGSRLAFAPDGKLFVTQGDRFAYREQAQDLSSDLGKVVRIDPTGSVPKDNPFVGREGARPEIWSYGHRNVQAATIHPETGQLWTVEHGARGGDELNHPEAGKNYGWPVITYGVDYSGLRIGEGTAKEGMEQPVYFWDPVIAPSGMVFYTGTAFPAWKGSVLIGSMQPGALVRLELADGKVVREERYRDGPLAERIRDVKQGPDGLVYAITDEKNGRLLRVLPAARR